MINDTYRSSLCLVHPPHLIALAAIYLGFALHPPPSLAAPSPVSPATPSATPRAPLPVPSITNPLPSRPTGSTVPIPPGPIAPSPAKVVPGGKTDPITFLASLNVDHSLVLEIVQEILSLYELWNALEVVTSAKPKATGAGPIAAAAAATASGAGVDEKVIDVLERMRKERQKHTKEAGAELKTAGQGRPAWKK